MPVNLVAEKWKHWRSHMCCLDTQYPTYRKHGCSASQGLGLRLWSCTECASHWSFFQVIFPRDSREEAFYCRMGIPQGLLLHQGVFLRALSFFQMWRSCPDWKRNITKCLWHIEDGRNRNWREIFRHAWRMSTAVESVSVLQWSMPCDFMRLLRKIRGNKKMLITSQEKQCSPLLTLMRSRTTHKILVYPRNFLTHDITQKEYHISLVQDVFFEFPISFR